MSMNRQKILVLADFILEKLLEEISFDAPEMAKEGKTEVVIDAEYVDKRLKDIAQNTDLSQFIL